MRPGSLATVMLCTLPLVLSAPAPVVLAGELSALIERAQQSDPNYKAALAAADAVRSERNVVRADLLPAVSFQARAGGNTQDIDVARGAFGIDGRQSFDSEFYEAHARQPILHWDRWLRLKQSDERIAQVEAEVAAYYAAMVMEIAERFFDVVGARTELVTSTAELRAFEAQLEQVRTRFELGAATEAEMIEAQADVDRAAAGLVRAQSAIDIGLDALGEIVGGSVTVSSKIGENVPLVAPTPRDIAHWTDLASERNPRVLSALELVDVANFDRRIARAGHLPTMDFVGRYGLDSQGGRFGNTDITARSIGVEIEVPIFQGGAVYNRRKAASYRATEARSRAEAARRAAGREAAEAFRRIEMSIAQANASQRALSSSVAALEAIQTQYGSGFRTIADVFEAQKNVFDAQRELADARRHFIVDTLKLKYASGELAVDDFAAVESLLVDDLASVESSSRRLVSALTPAMDPAELLPPGYDEPEGAPAPAPAEAHSPSASAAATAATTLTGAESTAVSGGTSPDSPQADPHGDPAAHEDASPPANRSGIEPHVEDTTLPAEGEWRINAASFRLQAEADALAARLVDAGYRVHVVPAVIAGQSWYRVQVTGFEDRNDAHGAAAVLGTMLGGDALWVTNN